jgi:hypothetical protein
MIEISNGEIAGLVRGGLLSPDNREDLQAIEEAVYSLFGQTIASPS